MNFDELSESLTDYFCRLEHGIEVARIRAAAVVSIVRAHAEPCAFGSQPRPRHSTGWPSSRPSRPGPAPRCCTPIAQPSGVSGCASWAWTRSS